MIRVSSSDRCNNVKNFMDLITEPQNPWSQTELKEETDTIQLQSEMSTLLS